MTLFKEIRFLVIMLASIVALINLPAIVTADSCNQICGYIGPDTLAVTNRTCRYTGFTTSGNGSVRINWSDGSYSEFSSIFTTLLVVGSCCSEITYYDYGSGIVTDGKYSGQPIIESLLFRGERQGCDNGCQSNSGLTRVTSTQLLTIGTKGVGQWIECTGNATHLYSPALTSTPQMVYVTVQVDYTDCSNCIESC